MFGKTPLASFKMLNNALSRIVVVGLLLLIFYYASILFWYISYPESFTTSFSPNPPQISKVVSQSRSWTWFRDTSVAKRKPVMESKINASLVGVISQGDDPDESVALISVDGKPAKIFLVGDEVLPSVFLNKVGAYFVHLENDGAIEIIEIKRLNLFKEGADQEQGNLAPELSNPPLDKKMLEEIMRDPAKLSDIVQFKLTKTKQGQAGFVIKPRKSNQQDMFLALGFMSGDIVVSANGKAVSELIKDPASWQNLLKSTGVSLQVIRHGVQTEVFIQ